MWQYLSNKKCISAYCSFSWNKVRNPRKKNIIENKNCTFATLWLFNAICHFSYPANSSRCVSKNLAFFLQNFFGEKSFSIESRHFSFLTICLLTLWPIVSINFFRIGFFFGERGYCEMLQPFLFMVFNYFFFECSEKNRHNVRHFFSSCDNKLHEIMSDNKNIIHEIIKVKCDSKRLINQSIKACMTNMSCTW